MVRRSAPPDVGKIDVNMTPMIDVVFQLMAFFLMTFKAATVEGDFELRLPRDVPDVASSPGPETIVVRLAAQVDGDLASLRIGGAPAPFDRAFAYYRLTEAVKTAAFRARRAGLEDPVVEIDADDALRYEHVLNAVSAVTRTYDERGDVVPLATRVKFKPKPAK